MSPGASKSSDNMLLNFMLGGVSGGISKVLNIFRESFKTQNLDLCCPNRTRKTPPPESGRLSPYGSVRTQALHR